MSRSLLRIRGQARSSLLMKQTSPKVCTITSEWLRMSKRTDTGNGISVARSSKTAPMKPSRSSTDAEMRKAMPACAMPMPDRLTAVQACVAC